MRLNRLLASAAVLAMTAPLALGVMAEALRDGRLREVRMYLHGKATFGVWRSAADALFGGSAQE